ncbi:hypothetical protein GCM10009624_06670 [Gordonia sinesedis]
MGDRNIILLTWAEPAKAYQAFSRIRDVDFGGVTVEGSAVVERQSDGRLKVADGQDNELGLGTLGGSVLGTLIGLLGGPVGALLGFAGGALFGSIFDVGRAADSDSVVGEMSRALPPGHAGLLIEAEEVSPSGIDQFAADDGATVLRRPEDEVLDEIAAAEDAAEAAAWAADEKMRAAKREERKEKREERVAKLKARLHGDRS